MKIDRYKIDCLLGEKSMTLEELSKAAEMSRQNLAVTLGRGNAQPKTLARISKALGVSLADITRPD